MGYMFDLFLPVVIDEFRNKGMDVRIPLEVSAEGMESAYHPELIKIFIVAEQIGVVFGVSQYSFPSSDLLEQRMVEGLHHRIP